MKLQYLGTAAAECWPAIFCECPACLEAARRGGKNIRHRSGAIVDDRVLIDLSAAPKLSRQRWLTPRRTLP